MQLRMKSIILHITLAIILFYSGLIFPSDEREITFERLEALPEPNLFVFNSLRVKKYNRSTYVIDGKFTIKEDLDDSMSFLVTAFNLVSGQYKKIFDKTFTNFCKTIWDPAIKDYYNKHCVPFTNIPKFGTCPWPKGEYWAKNFAVVDDDYIPKYLPGGERWKIDVRFFQGENMIAGYILYLKLSKDLPIG